MSPGDSVGVMAPGFAVKRSSLDAGLAVLERMGYECFYMAGELETPPEKSFLVEEASFQHPGIRESYLECFDRRIRNPDTTEKIHKYRRHLKVKIRQFKCPVTTDIT